MNKLNTLCTRNLRKALNNEFFLKKVHKVIKLSQNSCARAYIDVNADLRKKAKNNFQKDFSLK